MCVIQKLRPNLLWDEQTNRFNGPAACVPRRWSWLHSSEDDEAYYLSIWQSRATLNTAGSEGSTFIDPGYTAALRQGRLDGGDGSLVHQFLGKSISVLMRWH